MTETTNQVATESQEKPDYKKNGYESEVKRKYYEKWGEIQTAYSDMQGEIRNRIEGDNVNTKNPSQGVKDWGKSLENDLRTEFKAFENKLKDASPGQYEEIGTEFQKKAMLIVKKATHDPRVTNTGNLVMNIVDTVKNFFNKLGALLKSPFKKEEDSVSNVHTSSPRRN